MIDQLDELDSRAVSTFIAAEVVGTMYGMRSILSLQRKLLLEEMTEVANVKA